MREKRSQINFLPILASVIVLAGLPCYPATSSFAVINGGISSSEDAPFAASDYRFLPGDYLYFTFEIAGFDVNSEDKREIKKISLEYEVRVEDQAGRDLAEPVTDKIQTELSPQDKNWVPKRRASFLLPSFIAAGPFHIHTTVKDLYAKTETSRDYPFLAGGVEVKPAQSITVENFQFLRSPNDKEALSVPAYSPGDTVYARFDMTGFKDGTGNEHHVAYGVTVLDPRGKPFIQNPNAADLKAGGFYPAQFVPGDMALQMGKNNPRGEYIVVLKVADLMANRTYEVKQAFSIE